MCGFAGFQSTAPGALNNLKEVVTRMAQTIRHRGPDDSGAWGDAQAGIALGHRRLSILDLSPAGHQPMTSPGGNFVIVFNGEIYNHLALRTKLQDAGVAPAWRGHSDTETLLAAIDHWGIDAALGKTVGMFAFALWDVRGRTLHLARDRLGEKPLYFGWVGSDETQAFAFGSELKALRAFPGFDNRICRQSLAQYMRYMFVPAPRSIYRNIYKLEPGCLLSLRGPAPPAPSLPLRPPVVYETLSLRRWWSLADVVHAGARSQIKNEADAIQLLEERLSDAVRLQSLADVPLGAFLSGGVDSSAIVALMQQQGSRSVKTFTVGFEEKAFDESQHANAVARHLNTEHTELFVTSAEARAVIPLLPSMYDEPFADSSQIPTYLICRTARDHVTVALSGDAGDELFGGYNRYVWVPRVWNRLAWLPFSSRKALAAAIHAIPLTGWDALSRPLNAMLSGSRGITHAGDKAHKLATRLAIVRDIEELYFSMVCEWQDPAEVVKSDHEPLAEPPSLFFESLPTRGVESQQLRMMYRDSMTYLPDDILCKVDRAAMATSLETRVPFLDHRVVELAWQLPLDMKIRGAQGKWVLRQVLYKYVPRTLIERPKVGFGIPVGKWLRGPLRSWAESLLDKKCLEAEGYFRTEPILKRWGEHLAGQRDHTASLWAVLMFQAWLDRNR